MKFEVKRGTYLEQMLKRPRDMTLLRESRKLEIEHVRVREIRLEMMEDHSLKDHLKNIRSKEILKNPPENKNPAT